MRKSIVYLTAVAVLCVTHVGAAPLVIEFTDVDLAYDGSKITDTDPNGGAGDPNQADPLSTVEFKFNDSLLGTISSGASIDMLIPDVVGISADPNDAFTVIEVDPNTESYFDLLFDSPVTQFLRLDIDEITVSYADVSGLIQFTFAGGLASVDDQELPFQLEIFDPVAVSFSTRIDVGSLTDNGTVITGFTSSGTGEVTGDAEIPEPATLLLAICALGFVVGTNRSGF